MAATRLRSAVSLPALLSARRSRVPTTATTASRIMLTTRVTPTKAMLTSPVRPMLRPRSTTHGAGRTISAARTVMRVQDRPDSAPAANQYQKIGKGGRYVRLFCVFKYYLFSFHVLFVQIRQSIECAL